MCATAWSQVGVCVCYSMVTGWCVCMLQHGHRLAANLVQNVTTSVHSVGRGLCLMETVNRSAQMYCVLCHILVRS